MRQRRGGQVCVAKVLRVREGRRLELFQGCLTAVHLVLLGSGLRRLELIESSWTCARSGLEHQQFLMTLSQI